MLATLNQDLTGAATNVSQTVSDVQTDLNNLMAGLGH